MLNYKNYSDVAISVIFIFALFLRLFFAISDDSFAGLIIEDAKDYSDNLISLSHNGVFMFHFRL